MGFLQQPLNDPLCFLEGILCLMAKGRITYNYSQITGRCLHSPPCMSSCATSCDASVGGIPSENSLGNVSLGVSLRYPHTHTHTPFFRKNHHLYATTLMKLCLVLWGWSMLKAPGDESQAPKLPRIKRVWWEASPEEAPEAAWEANNIWRWHAWYLLANQKHLMMPQVPLMVDIWWLESVYFFLSQSNSSYQ